MNDKKVDRQHEEDEKSRMEDLDLTPSAKALLMLASTS